MTAAHQASHRSRGLHCGPVGFRGAFPRFANIVVVRWHISDIDHFAPQITPDEPDVTAIRTDSGTPTTIGSRSAPTTESRVIRRSQRFHRKLNSFWRGPGAESEPTTRPFPLIKENSCG
jgi:hypothetical protein